MQIAGFFLILMQLIAEPLYNVYFHDGNIYPVPTGVCYGENTPRQLLIWSKDTIILICWQHLSLHVPAGGRLQSWKMLCPESSGKTLIASHGAKRVSSSHWASCTRTGSVPSLLGPTQGQGSGSAMALRLRPTHGSRARPTWLGAAGPNRCSWSRAASPWLRTALNECSSLSDQHLAGMSSTCACFLLKGTSQPGEARFGPIALLWLPKGAYNAVGQKRPHHSLGDICRSGTCPFKLT